MKKAKKFELTFLKKEKLNKNTFTFYFSRKKGFEFNPGQYLKVTLSIKNPDDRGSSRYFTISSNPLNKEFITITTRVIKSSFKLKLASLKPGEKITAFGPLGYFDFDIKDKTQQIFLSGGMGITPFHSALLFVDSKKINSKIILIASFSKADEIIFYDELKSIESRKPNIKIIYTLTKNKSTHKGFEKGRISEKLISSYVKDYKKAKYFVIGPEVFEFSMLKMIKGMGIIEEKIFSENFPGYLV